MSKLSLPVGGAYTRVQLLGGLIHWAIWVTINLTLLCPMNFGSSLWVIRNPSTVLIRPICTGTNNPLGTGTIKIHSFIWLFITNLQKGASGCLCKHKRFLNDKIKFKKSIGKNPNRKKMRVGKKKCKRWCQECVCVCVSSGPCCFKGQKGHW